MTFKAKLSNCVYCKDEFFQTRARNNICAKLECKSERKIEYNRIYKERVRNGTYQPTVYKPLIVDTALPEVRMKNKFLLGLT